jgi:hypothetical protein
MGVPADGVPHFMTRSAPYAMAGSAGGPEIQRKMARGSLRSHLKIL